MTEGGIQTPGGRFMSDTTPLIEYASEGQEHPTDRLLRRIIAWSAIMYGGKALLGAALQLALGKGWLASPSTMSWYLARGWMLVVNCADTLTMCALLIGGVMLLRRSRASVVVLRSSVACSIALTILQSVMT